MKNILRNEEFEIKYNSLKNKIVEYLTNYNYDLGNLKIDDLIFWYDMGNERRIGLTEKCPNDIRNIITDFIKEDYN